MLANIGQPGFNMGPLFFCKLTTNSAKHLWLRIQVVKFISGFKAADGFEHSPHCIMI